MLWMFYLGLMFLAVSVPAALLAHRRMRQVSIAAKLKIESVCGLAEESFLPIGGIDQWISIRGEDRNNPVLLLIHGGPGSSYSIFTPHLRSWEEHFTIVQWDQRSAGRTLRRMGSRGCGEISMKQLACDAIELAEHLRAWLRQERIFLLASSMGSTFGLLAALRRPDLFYAYIGTDQNVGMVRGRTENHRQLLDRLRENGMTKGLRAVERIGADASEWTPREYTTVARWTMKSDPSGFHRTMKLLKDAVWFAPGWTIQDIRAFVKGMRFSLERLLPEMVCYDAWAQGTRFALPVFILHGEDDVLTPAAQAHAWFADIQAPVKHMEMIPDAGHFAMFLQPDLFLEKLLAHVRPLADRRTTEMVRA